MLHDGHRGSEVIVETLRALGVDHVFGLPGVHNLPIYDTLRDDAEIRTVTVRNESAASFMAQGYARLAWKPGVSLLAPGPGVTNALTGIAEAYVDSSPIVVLSGGIKRTSTGKGAIHDVDHLSIVKTVTKWCGRVEKPEEIQALIVRAFSEASSGRMRPTFVETPLDVQTAHIETSPRAIEVPHRPIANPGREEIGQIAKMLSSAENPVIIVGGGVLSSGATAELQSLSHELRIPVATTITAKEVIPDASPLSLGLLNDEVARAYVPRADVVLAVGCRFAERSTSAWALRIQGKLIHVDIDADEIGRNYSPAVGLVCDAKSFIDCFIQSESPRMNAQEKRFQEIENLKRQRGEEYAGKLRSEAEPLKPQRVMYELNQLLPDEAVIVCDSGNNAWWPMMFLESKQGRRFLFPSGNVSMGFALPAALGARCVSENVVCIAGDGGFMMQLAELATAAQEELSVTIIVLNDGGYGAIRHYQRFSFNGRYAGVNLKNPDFAQLAEAFGLIGIHVQTCKELESSLREALNSKKTTVLDVHVDPEEVALPDWIIKSFGDTKT